MEKSVFFLCDDHTLCESLALFLSAWYPASCVKTFENLEKQLLEHGAALLLLDFPLREEIVERIKQIKKSYPSLPVIFMTVYESTKIQLEKQLRPYVDGWFYKPLDIEEMRKSVEKILGPGEAS